MSKTALITGASSGIGAEMARIHAAKGGHLILIARREAKLKALKESLEKEFNIQVLVIVKDLSVYNAAQEIYDQLQQQGIQVDYLINNAGFGGQGYFYERDWEKDAAMMQVNMVALTQLCRLFLPAMVARKSGKILNVGSSAGMAPGGPLQSVYFASKAYVQSFTQGLAGELEGTGVSATVLCPGATATEFSKAGGLEKTALFKGKVFDARGVAQDGYDAMLQGEMVKTSALKFSDKIAFKIAPFVPAKIILKQIKELQQISST
ncbi:MAG: SDR family oxidoreductase [Bacteroidota bacterium]